VKLSTVKRITKETLAVGGGDLPKWIDSLLVPLNDYLEKMYLAVSGRLTFADNLQSTIVTVKLDHDVELKVSPQTTSTVYGCILINSGGTMVTGFKWGLKSNNSIGVTVQLSGATSATCTLVFFNQ